MAGADELRPGAWGGDARGLDRLGDSLRTGYDQAQAHREAQIAKDAAVATAYATLKKRAKDGDDEAKAKLDMFHALQKKAEEERAKQPKPRLTEAQKRLATENRGGDMISAMAEESARNESIAKLRTVNVDPETARRVSGAGKTGESAPARANVTIDQSPEAQPAPQPPVEVPVSNAPPSALAQKMKRVQPPVRLAETLARVRELRVAVEAGEVPAETLAEVLEVSSELNYAIAARLKQ